MAPLAQTARPCAEGHPHVRLQGAATTQAAEYPLAFCALFAELLEKGHIRDTDRTLDERSSPHEPMQTLLASLLMDSPLPERITRTIVWLITFSRASC